MYAQMIKSTGKNVKSLDEMEPEERAFQAVSYTHLTLPTKA